MGQNGGWFRRLCYKIKMAMVRFMSGRYGTDKLNMLFLGLGLLLCLLSMFMPRAWLVYTMTGLSYLCMAVALFRCFSRNTYKRYQENRRYQAFLNRLKDRDHKYYSCPKCRQSVRVPKGKGKIAICCPKCREKFVKKT